MTVDPAELGLVLDSSPVIDFVPAASPTMSTLALSSSSVPANGKTTTTVTVTVRDAAGNAIPKHDVKFEATGIGHVFTNSNAVTDSNGVALVGLSANVLGSKTVVATIQPGPSSVVVAQQPSVSFVADPLQPDDLELYYARGTTSLLTLRNWDEPTSLFSAAGALTPASTLWVANAFSSQSSFERAYTLLKDDGTSASIETWTNDGAVWSRDWSSSVDRSHADKRGFDIAYESKSGDALVVYSGSDATPRYRTRERGAWSSELRLPVNDGAGPQPDPNSGTVLWVELERREGSNEVALAYVDANATLVVMVWDGVLWRVESLRVLTTAVARNALSGLPHNRGFDLAWEASSGDLLAAWGQDASFGFYYATRSAAGSWTSPSNVSAQNGEAEQVDLASDPSSNRIALAIGDMGGVERFALGVWSGTAWQNVGEYDSQTRDVNHTGKGDAPVGVAWVGSSGIAVAVYSDNSPARLDWARWTAAGGWVVQTPVSMSGKGFTESVALRSLLTQNKVFAAVSCSNKNLYAATYDGSSWTLLNAAAPLEGDLGSQTTVPFAIDLKQK